MNCKRCKGACLPLARIADRGAHHARPPSCPSVQGSVVVDDSGEDGGSGSGVGSAITGSGEDGGEESPPSPWRIMGGAGIGSIAGWRGTTSGGSNGAGAITTTGSGADGGGLSTGKIITGVGSGVGVVGG